MEWLDKRLYSTKDEQDKWSVEEWRMLWAQLVKELTEVVDPICDEWINECDNEKERRILSWRLDKKKFAEEDVITWDLNKMTKNVKRLIKAQLLQSRRYEYMIEKFSNFKSLEELGISNEVLDIRMSDTASEPLKWYSKLNIKV